MTDVVTQGPLLFDGVWRVERGPDFTTYVVVRYRTEGRKRFRDLDTAARHSSIIRRYRDAESADYRARILNHTLGRMAERLGYDL